MLSGTMIMWISLALIYGTLVIIGAYKDYKYAHARRQEREDRRIQQNREWREQFNQLSPTIRATIRMMREDQRDRAYVIALLSHYNGFRKSSKNKIDWKKEGF